MGSHSNYPLIIYNLVSMKSQFQFITAEKFQGVIKELTNYEIYPLLCRKLCPPLCHDIQHI